MHKLHLNVHGAGKVGLDCVKRVSSIINSGSAQRKLKEVYSKISSFVGLAETINLENLKLFVPYHTT